MAIKDSMPFTGESSCFHKQTFLMIAAKLLTLKKTLQCEIQNSIKISVGNHFEKQHFYKAKWYQQVWLIQTIVDGLVDDNFMNVHRSIAVPMLLQPLHSLATMLNHRRIQCEGCLAKNKAFYSPETQHGRRVRRVYSRFAFHTNLRYPKNRNTG